MAPEIADQKTEQAAYWARAAEGWRKYDANIMRTGLPVAKRILALAALQSGNRVLDIASGTGEPALTAAEIVGPSGSVLLTDRSSEMLDIAREKALARQITNVAFLVSDGEELHLEPNSFDAVTSRWGIMFMPDPSRCLRASFEAIKPAGRIAVAVWGPPERNPFYTRPVEVLLRYVPDAMISVPGAVGIFAFSDRDRLSSLLTDAGFIDVAVEGVDVLANYDSGDAYWESAQLSGPISRELHRVPPEEHEALRRDLMDSLADGDPTKPITLAGYSLVASGTKPI